MRRHFSRGVLTIAIVVVVLAVAITAGVYALLKRATPLAQGAHCTITTPQGQLELDIEQADVAATIAAVAERRRLPERAVVIAYATAIQESKLLNIPFGDRDSVGVFQQRPSQGWGTPKQLLDVVYATNKFFAGLVKVKNYRTIPLHVAAQEVQRSADGTLYAQHEPDAEIMAAAFTGRVPAALSCWYPPPEDNAQKPKPRPQAAHKELLRALGSAPADGNRISASTTRRGWLIASWSMAHAREYGLREIRFAKHAWSAETGYDGWKADEKAGGTHVIIDTPTP
ncbi:hypothetical protein SAMN05421505_109101 [Sinosporangium album]|uniref:Uncharacterized protein n=1 Tax=Sinosporangium album TaxID=504805 RepID=A0A1G7Y572_9ACTN|nr:hypothetical protein [Sinosporangium album]SDG91517.1 hypothetical protein SAMN05421505_109101 [Sinosporangium album]